MPMHTKEEWEKAIEEDKKICRANAKIYGHTNKEADECNEIAKPICDYCPFITK